MKVSVLLLTLNEVDNAARCFAALRWCDDVVVVDSGSTDGTISLVEQYGARVVINKFTNFAQQRNFGISAVNFKNEWVLHLDADEVVTPEFVAALEQLDETITIDAYKVPSKLILFDRWLKRCAAYPVYQVRLGRSKILTFQQIGHGQRESIPQDRIGIFSEPYLHYSFSKGLKAWLKKHVEYAAAEAKELIRARGEALYPSALFSTDPTMRRRALKRFSSIMPLFLRPPLRFFEAYIVRLGFLEGRAGLAYSLMVSVYEGMTAVLAIEILLRQHKDFVEGRPSD